MSEGTFGSLISAEMVWVAEQIMYRYPNLRFQWIPPEDRGPSDTRPFAIADQGGIIVRLTEEQAKNGNFILKWLDEHDATKQDMWANLQREVQREKEERDKANSEKVQRQADFISTMARSPKHTFKHDGQKFGADNHAPTMPKEFKE